MAMTDDADLFAATDAPEDVTRPLAVRMRPARRCADWRTPHPRGR